MPITVSLKGTQGASEVQTSWVMVATGVSQREAGLADGGGDAGDPPSHGGGSPGASGGPAGPGASEREPLGEGASSPWEEDIKPVDGKILADVHLVWSTGGVTLSDQPAGSTIVADGTGGLTRLVFAGVLLTESPASKLIREWTGPEFGLSCAGRGDQLVTGFLCRAGDLPQDAVASHAVYLPCAVDPKAHRPTAEAVAPAPAAEPLTLWGRLLRLLFG
jgi:hypothetical protein